MPEIFIGIGSNVEPEAHVHFALQELEQRFGVLRVSPVYRNAAVGFEGDDFLNLVVGLDTELPVPRLMALLHRLERSCGRHRGEERWGPRTLDLDLLIYGEEVRELPPLPRPDVLKRAFVLKPLAEIAPDRRHPHNGKTFAELWARFPGKGEQLKRVELPEPGAEEMSKACAEARRRLNSETENEEHT